MDSVTNVQQVCERTVNNGPKQQTDRYTPGLFVQLCDCAAD